jgi:hypothetical protein
VTNSGKRYTLFGKNDDGSSATALQHSTGGSEGLVLLMLEHLLLGNSKTENIVSVEARESIETSDRVSNLGFAERFKRERWQRGETLRSIREILCDLKEKI